MSSWSDFETAAPQLAEQVRARLDEHVHKTLATIRRDGAPRISGSETRFAHGELWIGSMWQALKARDLQRDPRYALHSGSFDPSEWRGDGKLAGVVEEVTDPALVSEINGEAAALGPTHLFRLELREVNHLSLRADGRAMVIVSWTPDRGVRTIERE
ncbi:MAG TPA: pyridoxamine 5'-phosphate oxidase family protein [Conexibacter sp.]|nr:pyridoxamine 5'-phosphate oxidase family protein [Conexibacter sp.]